MKPKIPDARLDNLQYNLAALQGGRTNEEMAFKIRVKDPKTWITRKRNPETLTMREFLMLCRAYKKEPHELLEKTLL